jgi:hypothetical protein
VENRSEVTTDLAGAFLDVEKVRALELLTLSDNERTELRAGVAALPDPIRAACQVVLDHWEELDAVGRAAALLALANALADASDGRAGADVGS